MGRRSAEIRRAMLGAAIRSLRERCRLSQSALAKSAGNSLSQTDVSKIESGLRWPSIPQLDGIARALGVSAADLLSVARRSGSATRLPPNRSSQD